MQDGEIHLYKVASATIVMEMLQALLRIEESHTSAYSQNGLDMFPFAVLSDSFWPNGSIPNGNRFTLDPL